MFDMTRIKRSGIVIGAAAVTALGVGGVAVAQNGSQAQKPAQVKKAAGEARGTETKDGPEKAGEAPGTEKRDGPDKVGEAPGTETKDGPDKADSEGKEAPGQETRADSDGPGGHADEAGNAGHEVQGKE